MRMLDRRTFGENGTIPVFARWVRSMGGMAAVCLQLEYPSWRPGQGVDPTKACPARVSDFATQLTRLGFDRQNALLVSARAARLGCGAVTMESAFRVAGEAAPAPLRLRRAQSASAHSRRAASRSVRGEDPGVTFKPAWDDRVEVSSRYNSQVTAKVRRYFSDFDVRQNCSAQHRAAHAEEWDLAATAPSGAHCAMRKAARAEDWDLASSGSLGVHSIGGMRAQREA